MKHKKIDQLEGDMNVPDGLAARPRYVTPCIAKPYLMRMQAAHSSTMSKNDSTLTTLWICVISR
ncbi:MAG: hypothetical protein H5T33_07755 [Candidatus Methanosuratus sp.]|nr:hypothetical protein [Candidatus Methanosuratincola sp.]